MIEANPNIHVQNDWYDAEIDEAFWINIIFDDRKIYCKAKKSKDGNIIVDNEDLSIKLLENDSVLNVQYKDRKINFLKPVKTYTNTKGKSVESLDVHGNLRTQTLSDGFAGVWENHLSSSKSTIDEPPVRSLVNSHVGDIYFAKFFPSGKVVLTGGADTTLRIWDIIDFEEEDGCDAMLGGVHTLGITSADFIEKGRNIVSSSRDGSIVLWDVPTQKSIRNFGTHKLPINNVAVFEDASLSKKGKRKHESEFGTDNKLFVASSEDSNIYIYDIRTRIKLFKIQLDSEVNTSVVIDNLIYSGTSQGSIFLTDTRKLSSNENISATNIYNRHCASILNMRRYGTSCFVGSSEGAFILDTNTYTSIAECCGYRDFRTPGIGYSGEHLFTSSRDGIVRSYKFMKE